MQLSLLNLRSAVAAAVVFFTLGSSQASEILVLTGSGVSSLNAPLSAAGFTVVNGTLAPGQISSKLSLDTVGVYIWNDGSLGGTYSSEISALAFNAADQAALVAFASTHTSIILDGLAWRGNGNADEINFSKNEAALLVSSGGGIVLGADDASGALIVQHVNQVAGWLNYNSFAGIYSTSPANQVFGGTLLSAPQAVNPTNVVGTTTYSEVPNGLQPNGSFLSTAVFGFNSVALQGYGPSPDLAGATFNGISYASVNHIVTTNIAGGGIDLPPPIPEPTTCALMVAGLAMVGAVARRRNNV